MADNLYYTIDIPVAAMSNVNTCSIIFTEVKHQSKHMSLITTNYFISSILIPRTRPVFSRYLRIVSDLTSSKSVSWRYCFKWSMGDQICLACIFYVWILLNMGKFGVKESLLTIYKLSLQDCNVSCWTTVEEQVGDVLELHQQKHQAVDICIVKFRLSGRLHQNVHRQRLRCINLYFVIYQVYLAIL